MRTRDEAEISKIREMQEKYSRDGFHVVPDPEPGDLPFDLDGYRPDLLMWKGGKGYLVQVRSTGRRLSVDRLQDVVAEVRRHPGWGFLLVTADDVIPEEIPGYGGTLASWDELRATAAEAFGLASSGAPPMPVFLALWAALEGLLRHIAERLSLPVERLPSSTVIRHVYSHGGLSIEQYDAALALLEVRNRVAHGYRDSTVEEAARRIASLVRELLREAVDKAA